jgi:hypothetical protein
MDRLTETRILVRARFLAEIHIMDNDELGELARDILSIIDKERPDIIAGINAEKDCEE